MFQKVKNHPFLFQYYKTSSITCSVCFPMLSFFDKKMHLNGKKLNEFEKSCVYGIVGFCIGPSVPFLAGMYLINLERFKNFKIEWK